MAVHAVCCWCGTPLRHERIWRAEVWACPKDDCFKRCWQYAISYRQRSEKAKSGLGVERLFWLPLPRQVEAIEAVYRGTPRILFGGARGGGKLLALDTKVPTPRGFTTMGQLRPGDTVFGADGTPTTVVAVSEIERRPCYRITFDGSESFVAADTHEWLTFNIRERERLWRRSDEFRARRRAKRPSRSTGRRPDLVIRNATTHRTPTKDDPVTGTVRTTEELAASVSVGKSLNHTVQLCGAWQTPEAWLPIDPWVLGVWLGDGDSSGRGVTSADSGVLDKLTARGLTPVFDERYHYRLPGFAAHLRQLGVVGNKHIPDAYLWASIEQRLELLRGLMDTDGTCAKDGQASFSNTNENLSRGVYHLIRSLGVKATFREGRSKLNGVDHGPTYNVFWTNTLPVFHLSRKRDRLPTQTRGTQKWHYITGIEPTDTVDTVCIKVDREDGLFLIGEAGIITHNSAFLRYLHYGQALKHENFHGLILRRKFPELEQTHIMRVRREAHLLGGTYRETTRTIEWPNGSITRMGHCQTDDDAENYLSAEYDLISFDELVTFPFNMAMRIISSLRSAGRTGYTPQVVSGTNPGGPEAWWVRQQYIDREMDREEYPDYDPADYAFIPSKLEDNPYLDKQYEKTLLALPPMLRKAYRDGSWDVWPGQYFPEWNRNIHVAARPDWTPRGCRVYAGIDWGYVRPGCCLWVAIEPEGHAYVFDEYTFKQTITTTVAKEIKRRSKEWGVKPIYVADTQMWGGQDQTGEDMRETFARCGVALTQANKDRVNGWQRLRAWLAMAPDGQPWMRVHPRCVSLIRTLPSLQQDENKPEDVDTDGDDHWAEALRYVVSARPAPGMQSASKRLVEGSVGWLLNREARKPKGLLARRA
jgi:hypothetical protein